MTKTTSEGVKISLGKGIGIGITPGFMFNKNVGAELGINYLIGMKNEYTDKTTNSSGKTKTDINSWKGSLLNFIPGIVIESGMDKINPYAKFGFVIGIPSYVVNSDETDYDGDKKLQSEKFSGGVALGYNAALGVIYNVSDKIGVFGELNLNSLSYAPSKSVIQKYTENGADKLAGMKTRDKETVYEDPYNYDSSVATSESEPGKSGKFKIPFSSFGINIGIKIGF